ncbi:MAG: hypothetical protein ACFB10_11535 [Salibacteraceae bacterium]
MLLLLLISACLRCKQKTPDQPLSSFFTNEGYIRNLYQNLDMADSIAVFDYLYSQLPPEITIYPSESVYYVRFNRMSKTYNATLTFYPHERDSGSIGFGYVSRTEHKSRQKFYPGEEGGAHNFTAADGFSLLKKSPHTYQMSYRSKQVTVHLHPLKYPPSASIALAPGEELISATFDESGLQFYLVFNDSIDRLFWVLNEDEYVPETFHHHSENVVIGDRTEFAFYQDRENNRKIMVGVEGQNVLQNNWYDGPFDHLPDNLVANGQLNLKPYLEKHFPNHKDKLDKYGWFTNKDYKSRVALAPYSVYFQASDLDFVDSLAAIDSLPAHTFLRYITFQSFDVPKSYYTGE